MQDRVGNGLVETAEHLKTLNEAAEIEIPSDSTQQDSDLTTAYEVVTERGSSREKKCLTESTSSSSASTSPCREAKNKQTQCYVNTDKVIKDDVKASLKDYVLSRLRGQDKNRPKELENGQENTCAKTKDSTLERNRRLEAAPDGTPRFARKDCRQDSLSRKEKRDNSGSNSPAIGSDSNISPIHLMNFDRPVKSAMKKESTKRRSPKHVRVDPKPDWTLTEKRVWEEFKIIQNMEADAGEKEPVAEVAGVEAEWKVRRSKDGKHIYIRKQSSKPNKSRLLKERAERLAVERTGITTDDDANTIYLGRFWNKEERKRQLFRHRLKREKLLERQIAKSAIPPNPMDMAMAEIVQTKMTAPGHVFDDFLTVEEILTQRNRGGFLEGPIHVTTV